MIGMDERSHLSHACQVKKKSSVASNQTWLHDPVVGRMKIHETLQLGFPGNAMFEDQKHSKSPQESVA